MVARGEGCVILNICLDQRLRALTKIRPTRRPRAAVKNFTEWLAVHVPELFARIRVNAIAPGFFPHRRRTEYLLIDEATGGATARGQQIIAHTPMGRYGDPARVMISTVIWLMSPGASRSSSGVTVHGGRWLYCAFGGVTCLVPQ
jgi:NAD(P)-dependent dehydrogenase (short-subunit alcohol dehydrogenase family)